MKWRILKDPNILPPRYAVQKKSHDEWQTLEVYFTYWRAKAGLKRYKKATKRIPVEILHQE